MNTAVTKDRSHIHHLTQLQVLCVERTFKIYSLSIFSNIRYDGVQHRMLLPLFQQALRATFSPAGPEVRPINRIWREGAEALKEMPALVSRSPGTRLLKMYSGRNIVILTIIEAESHSLLNSDFGGSNHVNCVLLKYEFLSKNSRPAKYIWVISLFFHCNFLLIYLSTLFPFFLKITPSCLF